MFQSQPSVHTPLPFISVGPAGEGQLLHNPQVQAVSQIMSLSLPASILSSTSSSVLGR
jgi:hypothetical protein